MFNPGWHLFVNLKVNWYLFFGSSLDSRWIQDLNRPYNFDGNWMGCLGTNHANRITRCWACGGIIHIVVDVRERWLATDPSSGSQKLLHYATLHSRRIQFSQRGRGRGRTIVVRQGTGSAVDRRRSGVQSRRLRNIFIFSNNLGTNDASIWYLTCTGQIQVRNGYRFRQNPPARWCHLFRTICNLCDKQIMTSE